MCSSYSISWLAHGGGGGYGEPFRDNRKCVFAPFPVCLFSIPSVYIYIHLQ
jgi:hypothetical protein